MLNSFLSFFLHQIIYTQLREVAGARSKGRLPILSYVHGSGAAIVRCAQPLVFSPPFFSPFFSFLFIYPLPPSQSGMLQNKSTADIQMIKDFLKTNPSSNPSLVIADARPKLNAAANRGIITSVLCFSLYFYRTYKYKTIFF